MKKHQRIWTEHYGPIPREQCGRSYEIHHKDGNHGNNDLANLQCVTIHEHFEIHLQQGDTQAAAAILRRLKRGGQDVSDISRLAGYIAKETKSGIHGLSAEQRSTNARKGSEAHRGKRWFTDGYKNTRAFDCPGGEWSEGRTLKPFERVKVGHKLGTFWNNGNINKRSVVSPGPEWSKGKLLNNKQRARRIELSSRPASEERKQKVSESLKRAYAEGRRT